MKKIFLVKVAVIIVVPIVILALILNVPIFKVSHKSYNTADFKEKNNICLLKYTYTTGPGWLVEDSNNQQLIGESVCLYSIFDPRLLKDNNEFDMDYLGRLIITIDKVGKTMVDDEEVYVIYPKNITILYGTDKSEYRIKDMSTEGIVKSVIAMINKKYRFSY